MPSHSSPSQRSSTVHVHMHTCEFVIFVELFLLLKLMFGKTNWPGSRFCLPGVTVGCRLRLHPGLQSTAFRAEHQISVVTSIRWGAMCLPFNPVSRNDLSGHDVATSCTFVPRRPRTGHRHNDSISREHGAFPIFSTKNMGCSVSP